MFIMIIKHFFGFPPPNIHRLITCLSCCIFCCRSKTFGLISLITQTYTVYCFKQNS